MPCASHKHSSCNDKDVKGRYVGNHPHFIDSVYIPLAKEGKAKADKVGLSPDYLLPVAPKQALLNINMYI